MIELQALTKWYRTPRGRAYVFRDLSFRFPDGANIGLIGRNGAGKSTLMRLLAGIDQPNRGRIVSDVRLSWPVGLAGGFQGSLSARENVQFVCRIHGATGAAMRRVIDFVADFAEIGNYFDLPVSSYSTGMRARVAFGLSMAFDFDYYLMDEVFAVGDPQFRQKSQDVLRERLARSKVIIVSHAPAMIERMCDAVVLVDRGNTVLYEDVRAGLDVYRAIAAPPPAQPARAPAPGRPSAAPRAPAALAPVPISSAS